MIVTIHQPEHLPWLGFFNKLSKAELFVILDSVPFRKNYFQNRNQIMGTNGVQFVGIPVVNAGHIDGTIATTKIAIKNNEKWKTKYLNTIKMSYSKYPYFNDVYPLIEEAINLDTEYMSDINIAIIKTLSDKLGFYPKFIKSSEMDLEGAKSDLILDICKKVKATTYIAGPYGREYLNLQEFKDNDIKVVYNDYKHPEYPQRKAKEFVPFLSTVDLLMNVGFEEGRRIIVEGNEGTNEA